jgi:rSAM/selenodomain-associated transferase 2
MNSISVVIPVYNEAKILHSFLMYLQEMNSKNIMEFLVVDGQSTDDSKAIVLEFSKKYTKFKGIDSPKGRAVQMNTAAAQAKGTILYFLHADSLPPKEFDADILKAVGNQFKSGCFRMKFDSPHWGLKIAGWLTQLNWKSCRGGDQSLFIEKNLFEQVGGYDETFLVYEDNDLIYKLYEQHNFEVLPHWLTTSSRRYHTNGIWTLQYHFWMIHLKKFCGSTPKTLEAYYLKNIH